MTRRVVGYEGKETIDGRVLLPYALIPEGSSIDIGTTLETPDKIVKIIGKAVDFERDEKTGEISFDILLREEPLGDLNAHLVLSHVLCYATRNDGVMVIESAIIRGIHLSNSHSSWRPDGK